MKWIAAHWPQLALGWCAVSLPAGLFIGSFIRAGSREDG